MTNSMPAPPKQPLRTADAALLLGLERGRLRGRIFGAVLLPQKQQSYATSLESRASSLLHYHTIKPLPSRAALGIASRSGGLAGQWVSVRQREVVL